MASIEVWHSDERRLFDIEGPRYHIGRAPENDVVVDDPLVSRQHVAIFREGERYFVEDLGSTNYTKLDGEELKPWQPMPADHNSRIDVGGAVIVTLLLSEAERDVSGEMTMKASPGEGAVRVELTPAEREVLELLFLQYDEGRPMPQIATIDEIADTRASSGAAVKQVLQMLYDKLGLIDSERNKDSAARRGVELGLTHRRR